jgi:hypothetical protein
MTDVETSLAPDGESRPRLTIGRVIKWVLFLVVFAFVGQKASELSLADDRKWAEFEVEWLWWAAACYIVGWLPSVWFWRRMMIELGDSPGFLATTRAYYYGHLGKYVPGKALSLVIRSSVLKAEGVAISRSAITATIETLGVMGIGLAVWLALAPVTLPDELWQSFPAWLQVLREPRWLAPSIVAAAFVVAIPLSSKLLSFAAWKLTPADFRSDAAQDEDSSGPQPILISKKLLLAGSAAFLATWTLHGLSLGLTLRAIDFQAWQPTLWPLWSCAVAGATSVGFFALFAPGGLGIREGLLIATLQSTYGGRAAVVAAALYRVVCFVSELLAAGILYLYSKLTRSPEKK